MIDFSKMEVGVIKTTDDEVIFIIHGKMFGPFNQKQVEKVITLMESKEE